MHIIRPYPPRKLIEFRIATHIGGNIACCAALERATWTQVMDRGKHQRPSDTSFVTWRWLLVSLATDSCHMKDANQNAHLPGKDYS